MVASLCYELILKIFLFFFVINAACPLGTSIYMLMVAALCSQWIMGSKYRTQLRQRYNLVEAPYSDIISHMFCPCCSLCQEFRELRNRGLDPALGMSHIVQLLLYCMYRSSKKFKLIDDNETLIHNLNIVLINVVQGGMV